MKKLLFAACLSLALALPTIARSQTAPPSNSLINGLEEIFNPANTNGLLAANELNVSTFYKRDTANQLNGGEMKLDWWVTEKQGAFFGFEEYGDRSSYWTLGYQVRTVFKQIEVSLGAGTRQNTAESFGQVQLYVSPALTYRIVNSPKWGDLRVTLGADIIASGKPAPYFGLTYRFLRF